MAKDITGKSPPADKPLSIGWASRDVSTDKPVAIHGQFHLRISEKILDPITLTALVIDNGADSVIFLSGDVTHFRDFMVKKIRDRIRELAPALPADKIVMHATHTHTTGAIAGMAEPLKDYPCDMELAPTAEYHEFFAASAAATVIEAWNVRAPGAVAWGYGFAVTGHNRRVVYYDDTSKRPGGGGLPGSRVDGHARMYGKTNDPMFSHYEAGADHFVNLLYTFDSDRKLTGAIVNVPCPSQCSEHEWALSADFWHETRQNIRRAHGGIFVLPQCAAAGDISPRLLHYREAQARRFRLKETTERREIADRIAAAFDETLAWASRDIRTALPLEHPVRRIGLVRRRITPEEYASHRAILSDLETQAFATRGTPRERLIHDSTLAARRNRARLVMERYEIQDEQPEIPLDLHAVRLGEVAFVFNPFELFMDYMHRIQARSPFEQTFVVQLTGDENAPHYGYLPTARGEWGGSYSASLYCNQVGADGGRQLVEATLDLLTR